MSNVENLPPHVLRGVSKEVVTLSQNPPEGITVHVNYDDITDIQATILGPGKVRVLNFIGIKIKLFLIHIAYIK